MTASELLGRYGISVDAARQWIVANISQPKTVFDVARAGGLTSDMIAEILDPLLPGINGTVVENFFTYSGCDGASLRAQGSNDQGGQAGGGSMMFPSEMAGLSALVTLNTHTGVLSNESLRAAVLQQLDNDSLYTAMFTPSNYQGASDGVFTGAELGISGIPDMAATSANLESLYFGTMIKLMQSIDSNEIVALSNFVQAHQSELASGSASAAQQLMNLMIDTFSDPANPPLYNDQMLASSIAMATSMTAEILGGSPDASLFDGLFAQMGG